MTEFLFWLLQTKNSCICGYKNTILRHKFYADFVVYDKIILEVKGVSGIADEFKAQALNYLKVSTNKFALITNFGEMRLNTCRMVL